MKKVTFSEVRPLPFDEYIKSLSFSDLYAMYLYVSESHNKHFGVEMEEKKRVDAKYEIIKAELNRRIYCECP